MTTPSEPAPIPPIRVGQVWRRFDGKSVEVQYDETTHKIGRRWYLGDGRQIDNDCLSLARGSHPFDLAELISDVPVSAKQDPAPIPPVQFGQTWRRFDGVEVFVAEIDREPRTNTVLYGAGPNWYLENGAISTSDKPRGSNPLDLAKLITDAPEQP